MGRYSCQEGKMGKRNRDKHLLYGPMACRGERRYKAGARHGLNAVMPEGRRGNAFSLSRDVFEMVDGRRGVEAGRAG